MSAIDFDIRRLHPRTLHTQWQTQTRAGIRILELPTAQVRVRIAGTGARTLVFACDMPNVVDSYDEIIRLLGNDFRIVCFEQVGFGFSYPKRGFGFTLAEYVAVMRDMLLTLNCGPYTLVSPCVNVFQALMLAARHPVLVESLVLMQAVRWLDMRSFSDWAMRQFAWAGALIPGLGSVISGTPYLGQLLWAGMERNIARRTHPHVIHRSRERRARFEQIADPLYEAHEHGACTCFASAYQRYFDPRIEIPTVTQPTLVLWGTADRAHVDSDAKALLDYAPQASWLELADTGHHLELENPAAASAAIRTFLDEQPARSAESKTPAVLARR